MKDDGPQEMLTLIIVWAVLFLLCYLSSARAEELRGETVMKGTIHRVNLKNFILQTEGKIFSATFTKENGEERQLTGRMDVTKGVKGTGKPTELYSPTLKVFDMQKDSFRTINLATVTALKVEGVEYTVIDNPHPKK
jgi:hypothetical protein